MEHISDKRAKRRELERRSRQRRAARLAHMRVTHDALKRAVLVVHTVNDSAWERFLDPKALQMRRLIRLKQEATALHREQYELQRLLQEHELAARNASELSHQYPADKWVRDVERWDNVIRKHYRPWTHSECQGIIAAALQKVHTFQWSVDRLTTGSSLLGWRDARCVDPVTLTMKFEFHKTFRGFDLMDYVNTLWDVWTRTDVFQQVIIGHGNHACHQVLQQLTPNIMLIRSSSRHPDLGFDTHVVYLVFRVRTDRGFTQCVQSIRCPELLDSMAEPQNVWPSNCIWMELELLPGYDNGFELRIGGSLRGPDINYAKKWMPKVFECVVRSECLATGPQLVAGE